MHRGHMTAKSWWHNAALAILLFAAAGLAGCPRPAPVQYEWQVVMRRLPGALLSVSGFSERDVYAVGADSRDGLGPQAFHYDGQAWRRMDTGLGDGDLWWVHAAAPDAVFMVGTNGIVLRYNPTAGMTGTFERMTTPHNDVTLFGVWGANANDVWAVGGNVLPGGSNAVIWHYDGRAWTDVPLPMEARDKTLFKVWGSAANDVWVIGQNSSTLHWDGTTWRVVPVSDDMRGRMLTVHGNGTRRVAVGGTGSGILLESDPNGGESWRRVAIDGVPALNGVYVPPAEMGNPVAVGTVGTVLHRDRDGTWRIVSSAPTFDLDYHAVWIDPTGGIWAVGGQIAGSPMTDGVIYHFGTRLPDATVTLDPGLRTCPDTPGTICTWAGASSDPGFNGDHHHRRESTLYWPLDVEFSPSGQAFVLDWNNHRIRRVNGDDTFETIVGTEVPGDGDLMTADLMEPGALGTDVALNHPTDIVFLPDGRLLFAAWHNHKLRRWDPATGRVFVTAGRGPGFAGDGMPLDAMTRLKQPSRLALDAQNNIFVVDQGNLRIRRIDATTNTITTVAGSGMRGFAGDGGPPLMAQFSFQVGENPEPEGAIAIAPAPDGRIFVADSSNHRIRVIDLAMDTINTFAGTGTAGFSGDGGPATMAQISSPRDVEIGPDGNLWIADTSNNCVRVVDLHTNVIRTAAGVCGQYGFSGERGPATMARLQRPFGIAFGPGGHLYISDTYNNRVRRVVREQ
jgi:photosystem II stability/assembly factor-like uncharacterized protein